MFKNIFKFFQKLSLMYPKCPEKPKRWTFLKNWVLSLLSTLGLPSCQSIVRRQGVVLKYSFFGSFRILLTTIDNFWNLSTIIESTLHRVFPSGGMYKEKNRRTAPKFWGFRVEKCLKWPKMATNHQNYHRQEENFWANAYFFPVFWKNREAPLFPPPPGGALGRNIYGWQTMMALG